MNSCPIVYLLDDDEALLLAIGTTLKLAGYNVKRYASAESLLAVLDKQAAGCLISDLRLPGMSGIELQQALIEREIKLPIIFMTGYGEINESVQAIKAGALDFLEKPVAPATLLQRVKEALKIDEANRLKELEHLNLQKRFEELSPREKEVVTLVAEGKTNKEIAQDLSISYRTVEKYRASAMMKLEVENTVELAKLSQLYMPGVMESDK